MLIDGNLLPIWVRDQVFPLRIAWYTGDVQGKKDLINNLSVVRSVFVVNHGSWKDPFILRMVAGQSSRVMAAKGIFDFFFGIGAKYFKSVGFYPVVAGEKAIDDSVELLVQGYNLGICPEGWSYLDGGIRPFKTGTARIVKKAEERLGVPISIYPIQIRYGAYMPNWALKLPLWLQFLLSMLTKHSKGGTMVIMGQPFLSSNLPADVKEATQYIRNKVLDLSLLI